MSLTDLWEKSKTELETKTVQQIIAIAGDGYLADSSVTSDDFRALLLPPHYNLSQEALIQPGLNFLQD